MKLYQVTFADGTCTTVNGKTTDDATETAQKTHGKAVSHIKLEKEIQDQPLTTFESLKKDGPNF